jgi:hypothetical protein
MMPNASIVHKLPGRVRLRIPSRVRDAAYFDAVAHGLLEIDSVERVTVNPMAGSLLMLYNGELEWLLGEAARHGWFTVEARERENGPPFERRVVGAIEQIESRLGSAGAPSNMKTPVVAGLIVASAVQLLRGRWLPSGLTLVGYAAGLSLLGRESGRIRPDSR